jgi:hypothetical protein
LIVSLRVGREGVAWLLLAGAAYVLISTGASRYGLGLSPDSLSYLAAADSLAHGRGFADARGKPVALWPPLFPAVLALLERFPADKGATQISFQALLLGTCAFLVWRNLHPPLLAVLASAVTLFSFPLLKVGVMLWSDLLFTVLSLLAVAACARCSLGDHRRSFFWMAAAAAALATLTRYPGVAVVAACSLLLWRRRGFASALGFAAVSLAPLAVWIARNIVITGSLAGHRLGSSASLGQILAQLARGLSLAYLPGASLPAIAALFAAVTLAAVVALRTGRPLTERSRRILEGSLYFLVGYVVFVVASSMRTDLEPISLRYLAPTVPFVVISVALALGSAARPVALVTHGPYAAFFLLWACFNLSTTLEVEGIWRSVGAGDFSTDTWKRSATLEAAKQIPLSGRVFSNAADFLGFELGRPVDDLPRSGESPDEVRERFGAGDTIVWFRSGFRWYQADPWEIGRSVPLHVRLQLSDGVIFGVRAPTEEADRLTGICDFEYPFARPSGVECR